MLAFGGGTLGLLAAEVFTSNPNILFDRFLWIDELWTRFIESKPTFLQSMTALMRSGDPTPPVYHLLARLSWSVTGGPPEIAFRILSFLSIWLTLLLTYAVLRRTFAILPATGAVLAFWSSPAIVKYAFYARPYGPLLASTAAFCLVYCGDYESWLSAALTAVTAILMCTLHYFGIFALGSIVLGDAVVRREAIERRLGRLLPVAAGPLALLACLPFVRAWNAGQTVYSFMPPLTLARALVSIAILLGNLAIAALILTIACSLSGLVRRLGSRWGKVIEQPVGQVGARQPIAGMMGLMMVPGALAVFSALAHPVMLNRYMIAGLLGVVPAMAFIGSWTSPRMLVAATALIALFSAAQVRQFSAARADWQEAEERMLNVGKTDNFPIVTFSDHEAYVFYAYAPDLAGRVFIADLRATHRKRLSKIMVLDLENAAKWSTVYPDLPKRVDLDGLRKIGKFHLIYSEASVLPEQDDLPRGTYPLAAIAQALSLEQVGDLYEVQPK